MVSPCRMPTRVPTSIGRERRAGRECRELLQLGGDGAEVAARGGQQVVGGRVLERDPERCRPGAAASAGRARREAARRPRHTRPAPGPCPHASSAAPCTRTTIVSAAGRSRYLRNAARVLGFRFQPSTSRRITTRRSAIIGRVVQRVKIASGSSCPADRWSKLKSRSPGSRARSRMAWIASSFRMSSGPWR